MEKNNIIKIRRSNAEVSRFLEFSLGNIDYAIPLTMVKEVISIPDITPIIKAPDYVLGTMTLRGQDLKVVDLRKRLEIEINQGIEEAIVIINLDEKYIGIVVDSINKVITFSYDDISEMTGVENQPNNHYILGIYMKNNSFIALLDIDKVLNTSGENLITTLKKIA